MVTINGTKITMTRGDTLRVKVNMMMDDREYTPGEYDEIRFAAKRNKYNSDKTDYYDDEPLIMVTIPNDTLILQLDPEDTKDLWFGTFVYDIQLTMEDGTVDTFISGKLVLTEEVE